MNVVVLFLLVEEVINKISIASSKSQKNRLVLHRAVFCEIRRKCFLVSTAEDLYSSQSELT